MASAPFETEEGPRRATVLRYPTRASESGQPSSLAAASSRAQPINPSRRQRRTDKAAPTLETGHENQIYPVPGIPQRVTLSETWYYAFASGEINILRRCRAGSGTRRAGCGGG